MLGNVGFLPLMWIPLATALIDGSDPHSMTESPATLQLLLRNLTNSSRCRHGLRIPQILVWLSMIDPWTQDLWECPLVSGTIGQSFDSWGIPSGVSIVWTDSIRFRSRKFGGHSYVLSPSSHSLDHSYADFAVFQDTLSCCRGHCNLGALLPIKGCAMVSFKI